MIQNKAANTIFHWLVVVVLLGNLAYGAKVYSDSDAVSQENDPHANLDLFINVLEPVSYTHLTLPTNREV